MQIFISWSGDMSKRSAEILRDWLPYMNPTISPFVSSQDISKGERGLNKIADRLQECSFGIVCVTRDNQSAPWINFESGALSRELGESSLIPFLIDMQVKDLSSGPLTQFQATDSSHEEDVLAMVKSINSKCETKVEAERLQTTFDRFWGDLTSQLTIARERNASPGGPQREVSDVLDELVKLVREQSTRIGSLEKSVGEATSTVSSYTINDPKDVRITAGAEDATKTGSRVRGCASMARKIVGSENIQRLILHSSEVELHCTTEGTSRVHEVNHQLARLAADREVSITVFGSDGDLVKYHPPF
ncbi:TIR domain-containing protein [Streptomyces bathyalis]|uniref:TIR domain-containing protein n=1 Tax=Streptomyces bathyalis TaxID=2710756 RepID=A0A7T1T8G4_9ACTN|nr:toll/interleukin-1 receptor domain-containing protein [Streptomyces bathyalis]QPP08339.1 TIR domain-containing protein [Streptomyces bathyalis]